MYLGLSQYFSAPLDAPFKLEGARPRTFVRLAGSTENIVTNDMKPGNDYFEKVRFFDVFGRLHRDYSDHPTMQHKTVTDTTSPRASRPT